LPFLKNKKIIFFIFILIALCVSSFKFLSEKSIAGFHHPESAYFDGEYIYVSNIGLSSSDRVKDGFITKLDKYGNILEYKFIDNLQSPKGIVLSNNKLYISDSNRIVIKNLESGKIKYINIKNSKFLNDITVFRGNIYVTDTVLDTVFKVDKNANVSTFLYQKGLSPNGIIYSKSLKAFLVVSFNKPAINIVSKSGTIEKTLNIKNQSGFDGISIYKNRIYLSDYRKGEILSLNLNLQDIKVVKECKTPIADIYVGRNLILLPLLEKNQVIIGHIKE